MSSVHNGSHSVIATLGLFAMTVGVV